MRAIKLKTEYLIEPVGIDIQKPLLMWNCDGGMKQTAYHINASLNGKTIWDSGKVRSDAMRAEYPKELGSRQRVEWKVRLWDENDEAGDWSDTAFFETGLLSADDWKAKWVAGNYHVNKKKRYPVDCFKKAFTAIGVRKARLYVTACGLYEIKLNGQRVGNFVLAPGHTDYRRRIQYQTYDVTDLIQGGTNEITAELADGWYRGSCGAWGLRNQYGTQTKLLVQLELYDSDGNITRICTDESWAWSNDGPICFADNKDGEIVDARKKPSYGGRAKVVKCDVVPSASNNVPLTEHERFINPAVITTPTGKKVLNFGQNIAGYIEFTIKGKAGQNLKLRFGELIGADGEFTQKNIQCATKKRATPLQQVVYTCKNGVNNYKTKFAIFGFQYVLIEGDAPWKNEDFTAIAVYSDMEETLTFESSNELLNKFVECTRWSAKNNHADVPTDCPTRERHGWTGDAQIFCNTAGYLFNYAPFARKYERMLVDEQKRNGKFTQIVPGGGIDFYMTFMDGSSGWSDAGILIPYRIWKLYGDERILSDNYVAMSDYAEYLIGRIGKWYPTASRTGVKGKDKKYLVNFGQAYGEWAEPDDVHHMTWKDCAVPHPEVATAYTSYVLKLMSEIAEHFGKTKEAKRYADISDKTKKAYQALCETQKFTLDTDRQARLVRPLAFDLLNDRQKCFAQKRLIKALNGYGWRVGTGFLSTPLILDVLADIDIECAYKLLENEQIPGWLSMPKNGATTIWEAWEGNATPNGGIASLNHYSKGAVCEWIFSQMSGINIAGENKFMITPKPGGNFAYAKTEYQSVYGSVSCGWKRSGEGWQFVITVPANCTADIMLPDGTAHNVGAGRYEYVAD